MPTLEFEGKPFVYSHHLSVPFRELVPAAGGVGDGGLDGSLIVHGDNLDALKALLPRYAGRIDVIYIDPPYNTGKEGWRYDDKVSSPMIREWLGKVVDREDLQRHDKWLCMMWPRLKLLHELLSDTGVIFISIDDNELDNLKSVMDEIFDEKNRLGTIIWKNATDNNPTRIAIEHEYILCYAKDVEKVPKHWSTKDDEIKELMLSRFDQLKDECDSWAKLEKAWKEFVSTSRTALGDLYRYRRIDQDGPYVARRNLENPGKPGYDYDVIHPITKKPCEKPHWGWRFPEETMQELLDEDRIIFGKDETKIPELKVPLREVGFPLRSVIHLDARKGANDLAKLFGRRDIFKNPKPVELIELLLSYTTKKDSIVLDSFAGSGTTAHAVLRANQQDEGSRRFILVEASDYAQSLTAERVKRTIEGVQGAKDEAVSKGTGGQFTYCELGAPLDAERFFADEAQPTYEQVARYVVYTATGAAITAPAEPQADYYIGRAGGYRIHVVYRPDKEFLRSADAALTLDLARRIASGAGDEPTLVFAAAQYVSSRETRRLGIIFAQLPWAAHQRLAVG